jgi:N-acetylneuraminate synthase
MKQRVLIIAEAGVNHNGNLKTAFRLIEEAAKAGADFVKFQTYKTEALVSADAKMAGYQIKNNKNVSGSQFQMLKKLELSESDHHTLIKYCKQCGIKFLSTAFDLESMDFLARLKPEYIKIPSGEITNLPYLQKAGHLKKKVILSTGMSVIKEISDAVSVLIKAGTKKENISILHCTTEYPAPIKDVNLNVLKTLHKKFKVPVGYSDHTEGIEVSLAAVAMGAVIIEKHFTLDKNMQGPDHKASLNPEELSLLVKSVRNVENAMGDGVKKVTDSEKKNIVAARKSIFTSEAIIKGNLIKPGNLIMLRPGDGISPMEMGKITGKKAARNLEPFHKIKWEDIS